MAAEIDGLRRACGDALLDRVAPHLTLVSPINVRADDLGAALAVLRGAAAVVDGPVELALGPPATFAPSSPVLYLAVGGSPADDGALTAFHTALHAGPLARPASWPFVPHVTLTQDQPAPRLLAGVSALADYRATVTVDHVTLLEERRDDDGRRRWEPLADAALGRRVVVGRGSLPLELTAGTIIDPEAAALVGDLVSPGLVVTARRADSGEVVGVVHGGRGSGAPKVVVAADARGEGVDDHLQARWRWLGSPM